MLVKHRSAINLYRKKHSLVFVLEMSTEVLQGSSKHAFSAFRTFLFMSLLNKDLSIGGSQCKTSMNCIIGG